MLPTVTVSGLEIDLYRLCFGIALLSIPVLFFILRKHFGFSVPVTVFYAVFTLGFGLLSARLTGIIKDWLLTIDSGGAYEKGELLRNYGIPMFLPLFFLLYCALYGDKFRRVMDFLAPGVYSVMTFVKLGCVFCGCCYGEPDEHGIMNVRLGYRTFPVQLYDMLTSLLIVAVCLVLIFTLRKKHEGFIYPVGGILFALTKGYWEGYRVHLSEWERNFGGTGFTFWQFWMLILLCGCVVWLIAAVIWEKKKMPDFDEMPKLSKIQSSIWVLLHPEKEKKVIHHKKKKGSSR